MIKNRVRELRKAHGMTLEELAEKAGMTHGHLSKIERGNRGLSIPQAEKIAHAMGETVSNVIGAGNGTVPALSGLSEDAEPYVARDSRMPVIIKPGKNIDPWLVKTSVLDRAGVPPGTVVYVDISAETVDKIEALQCVVAQVYDASHALRAVTVLRQFVPPSLLITNSTGANLPSLDLDKGEAYIKGVVIGKWQPM